MLFNMQKLYEDGSSILHLKCQQKIMCWNAWIIYYIVELKSHILGCISNNSGLEINEMISAEVILQNSITVSWSPYRVT